MRSSREVDEITQADILVRNMKINTITMHVSSHFFFSFLGGYRVRFASERIRETYMTFRICRFCGNTREKVKGATFHKAGLKILT
jgi:hypothetical protein